MLMKRKVLFLLAALLLPAAASAYDACINGIYYNIVKKARQATVTYGDGESYRYGGISTPSYTGDIVIPSTIEYEGVTCNVITIGEYAFQSCKLKSLTIPATIKTIEYGAFKWYSAESVYISDIAAWCSIDGFETTYDILLSNAKHFYLNNKEITDLVIPSGVTKINPCAFYGAEMLTSVSIPGSVVEIGSCCFENCENIKTVSISNGNLKVIGNSAFAGCKFTTLSITDLAAWCKTDISYAYNIGSEPLSIADKFLLNGREVTDLVIPASVDTIKAATFRGAKMLKSVSIPSSVQALEEGAFQSCTSILNVSIGDGVKTISEMAFNGCSSLESVNIGNGVTKIEDYAFLACTSLKNVSIGKGLKEVGWGAVHNCTNIENVYISDLAAWCQINFSGDYYYDNHSWVETRPEIAYCNPLTYAKHLYVNGQELKDLVIPESVTEIGDRAFRLFCGLTSVTIHDKVTKIGNGAFAGCENLKRAVVGNGVETLVKNNGNWASSPFGNCGSLETLAVGKGISEIHIEGCKELTDVYCAAAAVPTATFSEDCQVNYATLHVLGEFIEQYRAADGWKDFGTIVALQPGDPGYFKPDMTPINFADATVKSICVANWDFNKDGQISVFEASQVKGPIGFSNKDITSFNELKYFTSIKSVSFSNCTSLTSVVIPDGVTTLNFNGCSSLTSINIPSSVTTIQSDGFKNCTSLTAVHITDIAAWCRISFSSRDNYQNSSNPLGYAHHLYLNGKEVTNLVIPADITSINNWAFRGCTGLTSVTIGNSVTSIGDHAFAYCHGLTSVTIGNSVTSIGYEAFYGCDGLTSVTIPNSVTSIEACAFYGCDGLTSVTIPGSVTTIGTEAFAACDGLTSVSIGNGVTSIGWGAFRYCEVLTSVTIPNSVTSIKDNAFEGCTSLTSVTIPNGVTSIGESTFRNCSELTSVTIPNSVTSIGSSAFSFCRGLASVTIPGSVTSIGSSAFWYCRSLTSVTIPNSVTSIDYGTFWGCSGLTSVTIGNNVTSIGERAFYECSGLSSVTIPSSVTSIGKEAFADCNELIEIVSQLGQPFSINVNVFSSDSYSSAILYVPIGTKAKYETTEGWKNFTNIIETDFNEQPKGDLNLDSQVNGTDVVALVNVIMQGGSNSAADVNGDGKVNGTDIVALVNIVMQTSLSREMAVAGSRGGEEAEGCNATAAIGAALTPTGTDGSQELAISLTNPAMDVTMVQMDVTLPEGVTLDDDAATMGGRTTGRSHQLYASHLDERTVRLLLVSGHNALIAGTEGDIVRLPLTVGDGFRGGDIVVDHALCTSPDQTEAWPQAVVLHLAEDGTMGIGSVGMADGESVSVHSLTGQRLAAPRKGVNIVNGKKIIVK